MERPGPKPRPGSAIRSDAETRMSAAHQPSSMRASMPCACVHELQVHQIELEMQNDELRRAHFDLEESRDLYWAFTIGRRSAT